MNNVAVLIKKNLSIETYTLGEQDLREAITNNIGNLVYHKAFQKIIKNHKIYVDTANITEINKCSCLIVPASNWISEYFDPTKMMNYLNQVSIPIVFIGLGCQAKSCRDSVKLHKNSHILLDFIKKRNCDVGCRGYFTQKFLKEYGIDAINVGCISNLTNEDPDLVNKLEEKWDKETKHYCCLGNNIYDEDEIISRAERMIFDLAIKNGVYIQQSYDIIHDIRFNNLYSKKSLICLRKILGKYYSEEEFEKMISQKTRFYISIEQWMEDIARMDLCFGTRIHGNILAQQSSCPSIVVYHDSRTQELAETMEHPRISVEDFVNIRSIAELKENSHCNLSLWNKTRLELRNNLQTILNKYGVVI